MLSFAVLLKSVLSDASHRKHPLCIHSEYSKIFIHITNKCTPEIHFPDFGPKGVRVNSISWVYFSHNNDVSFCLQSNKLFSFAHLILFILSTSSNVCYLWQKDSYRPVLHYWSIKANILRLAVTMQPWPPKWIMNHTNVTWLCLKFNIWQAYYQ